MQRQFTAEAAEKRGLKILQIFHGDLLRGFGGLAGKSPLAGS